MAAYRDSRDPADFDALYRATQDDVLTWILSLLRGGSAQLDARELLQETFINVFRYPGSFRDEIDSSFRVWVRTIAGNVLRRSRSNAAQRTERELSEGSFELPDEATGPAEQSQLAESAEHLRLTWQLFLGMYHAAWEQLAERDRRALWLAEAEALPYAEVGAQLGVRPANVKMIVFRARRRLAARMTAQVESAQYGPLASGSHGSASAVGSRIGEVEGGALFAA
jgi:RNA polymerase sigma factor (sigma-70 family)